MEIIATPTLSALQKTQIVAIWNAEYPVGLRYPDVEAFDAYVAKQGNPVHYLVQVPDTAIVGWLMTFDREGERWIAMLLDAAHQGKGLGSRLLDHAKADETVLNGWAADHNNDVKHDGSVYKTPIAFYLKNGFEVLKDIRFENEVLSLVKIRWKK